MASSKNPTNPTNPTPQYFYARFDKWAGINRVIPQYHFFVDEKSRDRWVEYHKRYESDDPFIGKNISAVGICEIIDGEIFPIDHEINKENENSLLFF